TRRSETSWNPPRCSTSRSSRIPLRRAFSTSSSSSASGSRCASLMRRWAVRSAMPRSRSCASGMRDVAYVALGSNLGDREHHLSVARDELARLPKTKVLAVTPLEETPPFGPPGQGPYLNQMVAIDTELAPHALLD